MNAHGTVFKYGDNIDTDVIIPARYLNTQDHKELASHCMEDIDTTFIKRVKDGDIMVGGWNFGCGSSREHAPIAIRAAGVSCVIAKTFARIFYRNAINIGLAILECPEAAEAIENGHEVEADLDAGVITDLTTGAKYTTNPFPAFIQKMMDVTPKVEAVEQRVTDHDVRIADCEKRTVVVESRVSGVEMKLDMVLANQTEQGKDIKDIYHLIMERHK